MCIASVVSDMAASSDREQKKKQNGINTNACPSDNQIAFPSFYSAEK